MTTFPEVNLLPGGVTAAQGFSAAGVAAQLRKKGRRDLALIYSQVPAVAAGVFTENQVKAAPVLLTKETLAGGYAQAIVANSGIANACTGSRGMQDAQKMAEWTAEALKTDPQGIVVASTGVIGIPLPMPQIKQGILKAAAELTPQGGSAAAEALMTTDTFPKEYALEFSLQGKKAVIGGLAKGAGMIHPNMATMLAFLTTDVAVSPPALKKALQWAVNKTFNCITIDGDTSTNDMAVVLANGLAGNEPLDEEGPDFDLFCQALLLVCRELAKMIAGDGEGATKFVEVRVKGALSEEDARLIARSVVRSNLVKTAIFGEDPNWGRILAAAGSAGVLFDASRASVYLGDLQVADQGTGLDFDEEKAKIILGQREVIIIIDLQQGEAAGVAWGCDLSYDYVRINGQYRT